VVLNVIRLALVEPLPVVRAVVTLQPAPCMHTVRQLQQAWMVAA
jgi:hypothetical protein